MVNSVGIVCPNYGGSTIFAALLNGYDGVAAAGELHWLFKKEIFCRECGESCSVYTKENIKKIVCSNNFYETLYFINNKKIIISGDKNPLLYDQRGQDPSFYIFLVKNPYAHIYSFFRRNKSEDSRRKRILDSIEKYIENMNRRIDWLCKEKSGISTYVVSFEDFLNMNDKARSSFGSKYFNFSEYKSSKIFENLHYIGGNHKVSSGGGANFYFKNKFIKDERYISEFSKKELSIISRHLRRSRGSLSRLYGSRFKNTFAGKLFCIF